MASNSASDHGPSTSYTPYVDPDADWKPTRFPFGIEDIPAAHRRRVRMRADWVQSLLESDPDRLNYWPDLFADDHLNPHEVEFVMMSVAPEYVRGEPRIPPY